MPFATLISLSQHKREYCVGRQELPLSLSRCACNGGRGQLAAPLGKVRCRLPAGAELAEGVWVRP